MRNDVQKPKDTLFTAKDIERIISQVVYTEGSAGLAGAFTVLLIGAFFTPSEARYAPVFGVALVLSALSCVLLLLSLRRHFGKELTVTSIAAKYYSVCAKRRYYPAALAAAAFVTAAIIFFASRDFTYVIFLSAAVFFVVIFILKPLLIKGISVKEDENASDSYDRKKEVRRSVLLWSIYWVLSVGVYVALSLFFGGFLYYLPIIILLALNFILRLLINKPFKPYSSLKRFRATAVLSRVGIVAVIAFIALFLLNSGANLNLSFMSGYDFGGFTPESTVFYDEESGVYTVRAKKDKLRILQLTDIHLSGSLSTALADRDSLNACYETVKAARPDLIVVTGDIVYPMFFQSLTRNNDVPMWQFATFMNRFGIPWTFVLGNHDTENATVDFEDIDKMLRTLLGQPDNVMLYAKKQPDIYGRYNQYIRLENADGSLERLLFLIDSNDYVKGSAGVNEYDTVHEDQIDWYEKTIKQVSAGEGRAVPSFVFTHIPFKAFEDAENALEKGSPDAQYIFGRNNEKVSYPQKESGFFDRMLSLGSTQAVFLGHDHVNNLAVKYKGIDLVYSLSIDHIAYNYRDVPSDIRGGTLITVKQGGYELEQIKYKG